MWFITKNGGHVPETFLTTKIHVSNRCIVFKNPEPFGPNNHRTLSYPLTWQISPVQLIPMRKTLLDRGLNDDIIRLVMSFTYAEDLSDVPEEWVRTN